MSERKPVSGRGPLGSETNTRISFQPSRSMQHASVQIRGCGTGKNEMIHEPPPLPERCSALEADLYRALIETQHAYAGFRETVDQVSHLSYTGTGFGRQIFDQWLQGQAEAEVVWDDERWAKYMDSEPRLREQIAAALGKHAHEVAALTEVLDGVYNGPIQIPPFHAEVGPEGGGYGSGYDLLHGSNKSAGDFTITGKVDAVRDGSTYRVTFTDVEYGFHDIVDPLTKGLDPALARLMTEAATCLYGRPPKTFRLHIVWRAKSAIRIRVPGFSTNEIRGCGTGNNEMIHNASKAAALP